MKCIHCNYEIEQETKFCPNCGKSLSESEEQQTSLGGFKKFFFIITLMGIGLFYFVPFGNLNLSSVKETFSDMNNTFGLQKELPKDDEIIYISSSQLLKAYKTHELKANEKYKDKFVEISGRIIEIAEMLGETGVTIEAKNVGNQLFADFNSIQCRVDDEQEIKNLVNYNKGDYVYAVGKVDGYNNISESVEINDCTFSKKSRQNQSKKEDKK